MKLKGTFYIATGLVALLMGTTCLAGAKKETLRVASLDRPVIAPEVLYEKPVTLGERGKDERTLLAMGRRIEEDAVKGAAVKTSLKASIELPKNCVSGEICALTLIVDNKGNIPVLSPILGAITLDASGGASAATKTAGWTCGYTDPKLTCASTGIVLAAGTQSRFVVDWMAPTVTANQNSKICFSLVWPGRPSDGVYRADQIAAVQYALVRAGFETGGIDGRIRPKTLQAIRLMRQVTSLPGPPQITPDLLNNLFGEVGKLSYDADASDDQACGTINLMPAEKKEEKIAAVVPAPVVVAPAPVIVAPAPAPVAIAPAPVVVAPAPAPAPVVVVAPAPVVVAPVVKVEEKKEAPKVEAVKPAEPVQAKKVEEAKSAPAPVAAPVAKVETKAAAPAPKAEVKPAAPVVKIETKTAEVKPVAPVAKVEEKKPAPVAAAKTEDRLASPAAATKAAAAVRPIVVPAAPKIAAAPEPKEENALVIISSKPAGELFYNRSSEERAAPEYYVIDRNAGGSSMQVACNCDKPAASAPKKSARKARKGKVVANAADGYIPSAREFLDGWPNIVEKRKF